MKKLLIGAVVLAFFGCAASVALGAGSKPGIEGFAVSHNTRAGGTVEAVIRPEGGEATYELWLVGETGCRRKGCKNKLSRQLQGSGTIPPSEEFESLGLEVTYGGVLVSGFELIAKNAAGTTEEWCGHKKRAHYNCRVGPAKAERRKRVEQEERAAAKAMYVMAKEATVRRYEQDVRQITHECSKEGSCKGGSDQRAQLARARAREKSKLAREKARYAVEVARIRKKHRRRRAQHESRSSRQSRIPGSSH
jgi:hypothetical protein